MKDGSHLSKTAFVTLTVLWLAIAGCGGESVEVAPVSGRVTLNGQPVANHFVGFQPVSGAASGAIGSSGVTDSEGRFTLKTVDGKHEGAVVGKHQVIIAPKEEGSSGEGPGTGAVSPLPPEASDWSLTFDVIAGKENTANFEF